MIYLWRLYYRQGYNVDQEGVKWFLTLFVAYPKVLEKPKSRRALVCQQSSVGKILY